MTKLIIYDEYGVLSEQEIHGSRMTIGRKSNSDIPLPHPAVSSEHALLAMVRDDCYIEDRNSTNGTKVNGKRITRCLLQNNDEIKIAKYRIKFVYGASVSAEAVVREQKSSVVDTRTMTATTDTHDSDMHPSSTTIRVPVTIERDSDKLTQTQNAQRIAALRILGGPGTGNELELNKVLITLGKPGVQTAVITRRDQGFYLAHLEGETAPSVNGRIIGIGTYLLRDRDVIELAGIKMEFFLK